MRYETFSIFPTTIYLGELDNHEKCKEEFYKVYPKFDYEENDRNNTVSENVGNPFIHLEPTLDPLFQEIVNHIKIYLFDVMKYKDIFNYMITKTWLSRARDKKEIPWHIHSTSQISFAYYVNMPPDSHQIQFANSNISNEFFGGINRENKHGYHDREMVKEYNPLNAQSFFMSPPEGSIILFPSNIQHSTKAIEGFKGERLAIVGDVTLTLKEDQLNYSTGYIDPRYWKLFN